MRRGRSHPKNVEVTGPATKRRFAAGPGPRAAGGSEGRRRAASGCARQEFGLTLQTYIDRRRQREPCAARAAKQGRGRWRRWANFLLESPERPLELSVTASGIWRA